ncbi:MAG TPA: M23 family metallopeptidase [Acidimicrobiales bacterium]|nr:M23 family metallopeptidase [Acidimicrobiales bacterium]
MVARRRWERVLGLAVALVVLAAGAPAYAQVFGGDDPFAPEPPPSTTTTTAPPPPDSSPVPTAPDSGGSSTTTTAPPPSGGDGSTTTAPPPPPGEQAPPPGGDPAPPPNGGDGTQATTGGRSIPPAAQAIMDSIVRSPANSSKALYEAVQQLVALGLSEQEAIRVGFGRFPIAGVANFTHDWYFPRWGPGFRFHEGTDVFAAYGTPVRSPVDGTATAGSGNLGGLYVKVFQPDGTYFYMAHLSGIVDGFQNGMAVETGDIVGYVGTSGNAKGTPPHVHLGIYSPGGEPTDPKPILDQWLAEAMAALPGIVEQVKAQRPDAPAPAATAPAPRVPRSLLATALLRDLIDERTAGGIDSAVLLEAVGNPSSGGLAVAEAQANELAASIDWDAREARARTQRLMVERATAIFRLALGPLAPADPATDAAAP